MIKNRNPIIQMAVTAAREVGQERPQGKEIADEIINRIEAITEEWPDGLATMKQRITETIHQWLIHEAPLTEKLVDRLADGINSGELAPSPKEFFQRCHRKPDCSYQRDCRPEEHWQYPFR